MIATVAVTATETTPEVATTVERTGTAVSEAGRVEIVVTTAKARAMIEETMAMIVVRIGTMAAATKIEARIAVMVAETKIEIMAAETKIEAKTAMEVMTKVPALILVQIQILAHLTILLTTQAAVMFPDRTMQEVTGRMNLANPGSLGVRDSALSLHSSLRQFLPIACNSKTSTGASHAYAAPCRRAECVPTKEGET
jgi:hypothetical protein